MPVALWRRPPKSGPTSPVVVLLHGRGADETDLISLADDLPRASTYVALRGFVPLDDGGYTWFENRGPGRPLAKSLRASIRSLRAWLDDPEHVPPGAPTIVLGFSAGMMMASALLLDDPRRFAGGVLLSGVIPLDSGLDSTTNRLANVPIFYGNGTLDTVLPPQLVAQTASYLRERSGAELTVREYRHAHAISPREIGDICGWMNERL